MNDFVIQGVTILGSTEENLAGNYFLLVLSSILTILFIVCISEMIAKKEFWFEGFVMLLIFLSLSSASVVLTKASIGNGPDTIYTISIDDTAKYNEIKNTFETITEQKNGLYEVTLKNIE